NCAASGAFSRASRAPSSAVTFTPLSTVAAVGLLLVVVIRFSPVVCGSALRPTPLRGFALSRRLLRRFASGKLSDGLQKSLIFLNRHTSSSNFCVGCPQTLFLFEISGR